MGRRGPRVAKGGKGRTGRVAKLTSEVRSNKHSALHRTAVKPDQIQLLHNRPPPLTHHKALNALISQNLIRRPPSNDTPFPLSSPDIKSLEASHPTLHPRSIDPPHEARRRLIETQMPTPLMDRADGILGAGIRVRQADLLVFAFGEIVFHPSRCFAIYRGQRSVSDTVCSGVGHVRVGRRRWSLFSVNGGLGGGGWAAPLAASLGVRRLGGAVVRAG